MKPNPYESPPDAPSAEPKSKPTKLTLGQTALIVLLLTLALPATAIASITTCMATYEAAGNSEPAAFTVGGLSGLLVAGGIAYLVFRISRRPW